MSTPDRCRPRLIHEVTLTTNNEDLYLDGHGEPTYVEDKEALTFHHVAVANGWAHTSDRTPYENLKAALEATSEYDRQRRTVVAFAFAFIRGYGPTSTPRALDAIADEGDVRVPGGESE
jgi:hypothetical protein